MKRPLLFLLISFNLLNAQDFTESWEGYFSYSEIVDVARSSQKIYAASNNAIFIYTPSTGQFETLSTIEGLTGDDISQIYYSEDKSKLVIGYENGILQIVNENNEITTIVAIAEKQIIAADRKSINKFIELEDLLYIATDFGVTLYDLERLEFNDTYFIGRAGGQVEVNGLEIFENNIYAATREEGILRASLTDPFLIDFSNWSRVAFFPWDDIIQFNNTLYAANFSRFLWEFNNNRFTTTSIQFPSRALDLASDEENLIVLSRNEIRLIDTGLTSSIIDNEFDGVEYRFTSLVLFDNDLYVGTQNNGLLRIGIDNNLDHEIILPDGPSRNSVFSVTTGESGVWIGYGDYDVFYNPFPLESFGISRQREDMMWNNYSFEEILEPRSVSNILINPNNPEEVFISSMREGIVSFDPEISAILYDDRNSSLLGVSVAPGNFRVPGATADPAGNLWFIDSISEEPLHRLSPTGQWTGFGFDDEFPDTFAGSSSTKIVSDNAGRLYWGNTSQGLFAFDPESGETGRLTEGIQDGDLINNYVGALRIDQNNTLWIGSFLGLRVLSNPSSMFDEQVRDARPIIIEDQNGIPRELLADQAIVDIEVDGNNNKWVATSSSGAFLFSPSGQETIFQFTTDNSPLPSNAINDIEIEEGTGKIYFATDKGMVSFQGARSSKPQEDLSNVFAFPNPVRPGFDGNVTIDGLTERARVKITDVEGNLVYEAVSQGGSIPWDTRSFSGDKVSSGVYFLLINTDDVIETTVFKLMIIR
ncbi:MAG: T9SS type A sorting domain-containing protein [Nonlabens sp.]